MRTTCDRCGGYSERGLCPACVRNDLVADEQRRIASKVSREENWAKEQRDHQNNIKNVSGKLLELALEAVENAIVAKKKVKVLIKSASFSEIERELFSEIRANNFLADCYYTTKLGLNPTLDSVKKLHDLALEHIPEWVIYSEESVYSKKVLNLYLAYKAELDAEQKRQEEEEKRSEQKRKRQEARQKKEDQAKENEYSDFIEQNFGHNRGFVKTEDIQKKQTSNRFGEYISYLFISLIAIWFIYSVFTEISNLMQSQLPDDVAQQERELLATEYRLKKNRVKETMNFQNADEELRLDKSFREMDRKALTKHLNKYLNNNLRTNSDD
jgi:hypothetical protein